jgi:methyl-accepting chemotaxis protein
MAANWGALALECVGGLSASGNGAPQVVSATFVTTDGGSGVVHVRAAAVTEAQAGAFASAFVERCQRAGAPVRVVSLVRIEGAPLGVEWQAGGQGVSVAVSATAGDAEVVRRVHVTRSISAAQELAEASVLQIGDELRGIFELAQTNSGTLERLVGQYATGQGRDTIASSIDTLGAAVATLSEKLVDRLSGQARTLEQAQQWTSDIVRLGDSIATIAASARMLTFNARVESARIGDAGRGFSVIAQSIQELATQVRETNDAVSQLAAQLARVPPVLASDAQGVATDASTQISLLTTSLSRVQHQLQETRTQAHASLVASTEHATRLERRANEVLVQLQFQDRTHQLLDEAKGQASALLRLVGLDESKVDQRLVEQVGALGKRLDSPSTETREAGSIELF